MLPWICVPALHQSNQPCSRIFLVASRSWASMAAHSARTYNLLTHGSFSELSKVLNVKRQFTNTLNEFPWPCHPLALQQGKSLTLLPLFPSGKLTRFLSSSFRRHVILPAPHLLLRNPQLTRVEGWSWDEGHADVPHWAERASPGSLPSSCCRCSAEGTWTRTFHVYRNILMCVDLMKINIFAENVWQVILSFQSLVYPALNGVLLV